jgi:hypothetical protein
VNPEFKECRTLAPKIMVKRTFCAKPVPPFDPKQNVNGSAGKA